jgi:alanyl-tRNA synthetase
MSNRLYYADSYTRDFEAHIVEHLTLNGHPAIILKDTYFYPTSGGQPHDTGSIGTAQIIDVITRDKDGAVIHILDQTIEGNTAEAHIHWERRFDHMQHHTGQHILSQAFIQIANASTIGFHLSENSVTIDLDVPPLATETVNNVEDLANQIIYENRAVTAQIINKDDAGSVRIRKLPDHLLTDGLRVVEIADFDMTACGGTHVRQSGEIGIIKILKVEKRGEKSRVEFRCGGRALQDFREKNSLINRLTAELTVSMDEIPDTFSRTQEQVKTLQRDLKAATSQLISFEATQLLENAAQQGEMRVITSVFPGRDMNDLKLLASKLTAEKQVVALLGSTGERANIVFSRSADLIHDMNALLKSTLETLGGRGGGQPTLAQGSAPADETALMAALAEAAAHITA